MGQCQGHCRYLTLKIIMIFSVFLCQSIIMQISSYCFYILGNLLPEVFVFLVLYSYLYRPVDNRVIMVSVLFLPFPLRFVMPVMLFVVVALLVIFALDLFCTWVRIYFYRHAYDRLSQLERRQGNREILVSMIIKILTYKIN